MPLRDILIRHPGKILCVYLVISILIGLPTIALFRNITIDPKDYLPQSAESIQVLDKISQETIGLNLVDIATQALTLGKIGDVLPVPVHLKSDRKLDTLESIQAIVEIEDALVNELGEEGVVSTSSYATLLTQISVFYGGEEGKYPPLRYLMNFMDAHNISMFELANLSMPFDMQSICTKKMLSRLQNLPPSLVSWLGWILGKADPEIRAFFNEHNLSRADLKELLTRLQEGSDDPEAEVEFIFNDLLSEVIVSTLMTPDRQETMLMVNLDPDMVKLVPGQMISENEQLFFLEGRIEDVILQNSPQWINPTVAGPASMGREMNHYMFKWMAILIGSCLAMIAISISVFHRNGKSVLLVLIPTGAGIILNLGILGILVGIDAITFSFENIIIAPTLISFGFAYSLHLANRFAEEVKKATPEEALRNVFPSTGKAVLLSAVTTMVGFASLAFTPIPAVSKMALVFVLGIFCLYLSAIILVPCLLLLLHYRKRSSIKNWSRTLRVLTHPSVVVAVVAAITVLSLLTISQVSTEVDIFGIKPPAELELSTVSLNYMEKLQMEQPGIFLVEGDLRNPEFASSLEDLIKDINKVESCRAYSILELMKPFNLGETPTGSQIENILSTAGETITSMMFPEGGIDVETILLDKNLVIVQMPAVDIVKTTEMVNEINGIIDLHQLQGGESTHLTGVGAILADLNALLLPSQMLSLLIAIAAVFACLVLIFRSLKFGIFTMIPLTLVILWEPLILVSLRIPLSVITVAVASIVMGTGIDFGIHITGRIKEEVERGKSGTAAAKVAIMTTGQSLVETIVVVILGLLPIFLLNILMVSQFIVLIIIMLTVACVSALFVLPTIYMIYYRKEPVAVVAADMKDFYEETRDRF